MTTSTAALRRSTTLFATLFCLLLAAAQARGQAPSAPRPKVGLALSGGSALGLSHLGVLQWFDEHHIPIDCISGTSMGGLIAGAYASGMAPAEIEALFSEIDWQTVLGAAPPHDALPFRRKEDRRNIPTQFRFGLAGGRPPLGLTPAQPIGAIFSRVSLPHSPSQTFDDLPIPFRCIATDIEAGVSVTLKDGPLETALRATMAYPGVFTPIRRDGKLLVDGGLLNNLPTEAAKEMGADVIIAVDLSASGESRRLEIGSVFGLLGQVINTVVRDNERRSLQLADIVLAPDLKNLTMLDFTQIQESARRGYNAAEANAARLLPLALPEAEWQQYLAKRRNRQGNPELTPRFIHVVGTSEKLAGELKERLAPFQDVPLQTQQLETELLRITGEGRFDSLLYERDRQNGQEGLLIRAEEDSFGSSFLDAGVFLRTLSGNNTRFAVALRATTLDVGHRSAEVRADLSLGSDSIGAVEYYRPLGSGPLFLAPHVRLQESYRNVYQDGVKTASYVQDVRAAGVDLGYAANGSSQFRLGYDIGHLKDAVNNGPAILPQTSGNFQVVTLRATFDGQDSPGVPTRGTYAILRANWYFQAPGTTRDLPTAEVRWNHFQPSGKYGSWFGTAAAGTTFGTDAPPPLQFTLGGPFRLSAFDPDEFRGRSYALLSAGYLHCIARLPAPFGDKISVGGWYEYGGASEQSSTRDYVQSVSLGAIAETGLGPVAFGASFGQRGRRGLFVALGPLF